ncbi:GDSL-type esterase/lipase family protein [Kitasatospora sp. NPDC056181]|uniref:GDSL-type esterase/lipase family protein n=1 Tax=Kitasatospora sp. NPDC056181 TaxID=3345737 RepID=UPI0035E052FA
MPVGPAPSATPAPTAPTAPSAPPESRPTGPSARPRRPAGLLGRARPAAARLYSRLLMRRPPADWSVPRADGRYGPPAPADDRPLALLMLGDSLAQSLGAGHAEETLGARLAQALGEQLGRPVDLRVLARAGATTTGARRQATRAARLGPGIAVLIVGSNDMLLPLPLGRSARGFAHLVRVLREAGWQPVVVPCPDPAHGPGFRAPARWAGGRRARRLARLHIRAAQRVGAVLAPSSGGYFRERADELLSPDGVHPSPQGYAEYAQRMLPAVLTAAGLLADAEPVQA